jgi:hypothetical protein
MKRSLPRQKGRRHDLDTRVGRTDPREDERGHVPDGKALRDRAARIDANEHDRIGAAALRELAEFIDRAKAIGRRHRVRQ